MQIPRAGADNPNRTYGFLSKWHMAFMIIHLPNEEADSSVSLEQVDNENRKSEFVLFV